MKRRAWTMPAVAITVFLMAAVLVTARAQQSGQPKITNMDRQQAEEMLSRIHDAVKKDYYDPKFHGVDMDARYQKYEAALKVAPTLGEAFRIVAAFLAGLHDSHTYFVPPSISYRFDYGFRMQMIGDRCFITEVRAGSDAASKIHPGDEILKLGTYAVHRDDYSDIEYYLNSLAPQGEMALLLRDPQGTTRSEAVRTKFLPGKKVGNLTLGAGGGDMWNLILRQESLSHMLRQRWVEIGDTFIWKIPAFNMTPDEIGGIMSKANKHGALVIDLRGNPGGSIDSLVDLAGYFFDHDVTIATPIGRKHEKEIIAKPRGKPFTGKLFVLVDGGSASASELFARTIQLNHRATVLGDLTAGAVMESKIYPFQIGVGFQSYFVGRSVVGTSSSTATGGNDLLVFYAASITHDDLIMTDGKSLEKTGVTPDTMILPTAADLAAGRDPVLSQAVALAGAKLDPAAAGKLFPFEWAPLNGQ